MRCDLCSREFKNARGVKIHIQRKHKSSHTPTNPSTCDYFTPLSSTLFWDCVFPLLQPVEISSLLQTCKTFRNLANENKPWWAKYLTEKRLYTSDRPYPEYPDNPGLVFLRLANHVDGGRRRPRRGVCFSCLEDECRTSIHSTYKIPLCSYCSKQNDVYRYITKSVAMSEYCLTKKEVTSLPHVLTTNPYYSSAAPMSLYLVSDIVQKAGDRDIQAIKDKRKRIKEKRLENKLKRETLRRGVLEAALDKVGVQLRDDSELCKSYIEGSKLAKNWIQLNDIVNEMAFMKYLHEYTDYNTKLEQEVYELKMEYGYYYQGIWRDASEFVKLQYTVPDKWPWVM